MAMTGSRARLWWSLSEANRQLVRKAADEDRESCDLWYVEGDRNDLDGNDAWHNPAADEALEGRFSEALGYR